MNRIAPIVSFVKVKNNFDFGISSSVFLINRFPIHIHNYIIQLLYKLKKQKLSKKQKNTILIKNVPRSMRHSSHFHVWINVAYIHKHILILLHIQNIGNDGKF